MTLSNFDWTDKDSVKWFLLLPSGHEGPYALNTLTHLLQQNKVEPEVKVWAEGLNDPISLLEVLNRSGQQIINDDLPPPLPFLLDDELPPLPFTEGEEFVSKKHPDSEETSISSEVNVSISPVKRKWARIAIFLSLALMVYFILSALIKGFETLDIRRYPKMTLELHEKILKELSFQGWDKKIFFKEYLPIDHSHIWLVTASFQRCKVEAEFNSIPEKLLTVKDERVTFKTSGTLSDHVVEFSNFDFSQGNKIIPGLYEMDVKASECEWDGFLPKLMNLFSSSDENYVGRTKVVLFSKGAREFSSILDRLIQKKMEKHLKDQNKKEFFWQDIQQKLETLQAITLQIEQLFLDFLEQGNVRFSHNLRPVIDQYTRKYGSFLTTFVVENEKYFKSLTNEDISGISNFKNYELMVNLTSKRIGLETMKYIEEMQSIKGRPEGQVLARLSARMKTSYSGIKTDISRKIIRVSEDRSK